MNKEEKSLKLSIVVVILVLVVSGLAFHYVSKNQNLLKNANEDVKVAYNVSKSDTVMSFNENTIYMSSNIIDVSAEDTYHYKLVLETVDNYNEDFSYTVKLNDTILIDEEIIHGYKEGDVITLYDGVFPDKTCKLSVILKGYNYSEDKNMDNKIEFVY